MNDTERAAAAIGAICGFMDEAKLKYERRAEQNTVFVTITGEDFPVTLMFAADAESGRVETYSQLPFEIKTEKNVDIAMALAAINCRIAYGKFCLYMDRQLCTFENSEYITDLEDFTPAYGKALVAPAYATVEQYNDKLYALNKGLMTLKDFLASVKN